MPWPLSQDYNESVQSPAICLGDAELKQGEATVNGIGLPRAWSGNFADVYQLNCGQRKWAVKCFTRQVAGLRERYSEISAYLAQAKLPFMVEFKYLDQGVRVRGQWYPVLKMHWVEGLTLNEFVKQHADNPPILDLLAQIWVRMAKRLREANMAHADLQHGNVLLVPGSTAKSLAVKLIDYDGMFVPALAQKRSGEVGHGAYQHPQRLRDGTYTAEVDRFPNLVIYTALRALMVGSRYLWNKYDNGDNLLFKQADLEAPNESAVFQELLKLNDPEVRKLAQMLKEAARLPLGQVPLLEEVAPASTQITATPPAGRAPKPASARTVEAPENLFAEATAGAGAPPRRRTQAKSRGLLWAGIGVAVAALIGLGVFFATRPSSPEKTSVAANVPPKQVDPAPLPKVEPKPPVEPKPEPKVEPKLEPVLKPKPEPKVEPKPEPKVEPKPEPKVAPKPVPMGQPGVADAAGDPLPPDAWARLGVTRLRQGSNVRVVAFAPDGKSLVSAGGDDSVRLWEVPTGKALATLGAKTHRSMVGAAAFSPDGKTLVTGASNFVHFWDVRSGKEARQFEAATKTGVTGLAFSPDGKVVAARFGDPVVRLLDSATGRELHQLATRQRGIQCAVFSADGQVLAMGGLDPDIEIWDVASGKLRLSFPLPGQSGSLAFTPDSKTLVAGRNQGIFVCEAATGKQLLRINLGAPAVALSPDGKVLAAGHFDRPLQLYELQTGKELRACAGPAGRSGNLTFSPDGTFVAATRFPLPVICLWDVATGQPVHSWSGHESSVSSVAVSPDGTLLASGSHDRTVRLWDPASGRELQQLRAPDAVSSVAISPDGKTVACGLGANAGKRVISLWDAATGKELNQLAEAPNNVSGLAFSPDGMTLAAGGQFDKTVRLFDLATGKLTKQIDLPGGVSSLAFTPDGKALALNSAGSIELWSLATSQLIRKLGAHRGSVFSVGITADGKKLVSCAADDTARLWEASSGKELLCCRGHDGYAFAAAVSPDGRLLASAGRDLVIHLWDAASGKELSRFQGHAAFVKSLVFTPDGQYLVSASDDTSILLWDVRRWRGPVTGKPAPKPTGNVPALLSPAAGAVLENGRTDRTRGLNWEFRWSPVPQASHYHLHVMGPGAPKAIIDNPNLTAPQHRHQANAYIADANRMGWKWKVRARVNGVWGGWSEERSFDVQPPDTGTKPAPAKEIRTLLGHNARVNCAVFSGDGTQILSGGADQTPRIWDVQTGKELRALARLRAEIHCVAWSQDSNFIAVGSASGETRIFRMDGQRSPGSFYAQGTGVSGVVLLPNNQAIAGTLLGQAKGYHPGIVPVNLGSGNSPIHAVAVSRDGRNCLFGHADGSATLCDAEKRSARGRLVGHKQEVLAVALSADGKLAATGGADQTLRIWDTSSGKTVRVIQGHTGKVTAVALTPDANRIVSGSEDKTVRIWDVKTGRELERYTGHTDAVTSVAVSPDGRMILSSSADQTIRLWPALP